VNDTENAKGPNAVRAYSRDSFVTVQQPTTTTIVSIVIPTMSSGRGPASPSGGPVIRCGHLKKLKTMKKKYFVLRGEGPGCLACLEYYDSKKKFENRQPPKRSILLHSCFNINKRGDTKHKHVIALYTKDECFCLILDSEKELDEWLKAMLRLQSGDVPDGEQPRPTFGKLRLSPGRCAAFRIPARTTNAGEPTRFSRAVSVSIDTLARYSSSIIPRGSKVGSKVSHRSKIDRRPQTEIDKLTLKILACIFV